MIFRQDDELSSLSCRLPNKLVRLLQVKLRSIIRVIRWEWVELDEPDFQFARHLERELREGERQGYQPR